MAAAPKYSYVATTAAQNAIATLLNSGKLRIYASGSSPPADADAAIVGTLLAELTLNATFATSVTNGVITAAAITACTDAAASGTADYFRLWKTDGTTCMFQGTVGTATADLILNSVAIVIHAAVSVTSLTLTLPRS